MEFQLTISVNSEQTQRKILLKIEWHCTINGIKNYEKRRWKILLCEVALTCLMTVITYYINRSAYVHMLNENKDFVMTVKIFKGSSSALP